MAKVCAVCGKKAIIGGKRNLLRGKYNPTQKTKKYPNLQWTKLPNGKRVKVCTQCLRTLAKQQAK